MPLLIVRNDITKMRVDAIVNAADPSLLGGGGVDGAIHHAAGPELLEECRKLGGCTVGEAKVTGAYRLPCRRVIHTVGPKWRGGMFEEQSQLASCYRSSLALALEEGCETVAFPLISTGALGYPTDKAIRTATDTIAEFLLEHEMKVYLVLYDAESLKPGRRLFADIQEYIDDRYVELCMPIFGRKNARADDAQSEDPAVYSASVCATKHPKPPRPKEKELKPRKAAAKEPKPPKITAKEPKLPTAAPGSAPPPPASAPRPAAASMPWADLTDDLYDVSQASYGIDRLLGELDESFQQMLLRKIDESGMSDAQCYKRANIDRKLFSKIRGDLHYRPKKSTALAFAVALRLDLAETDELLRKAGYALSRSNKFDVIVQYFIERRIYDIYEINETLFYYDQSLLGS